MLRFTIASLRNGDKPSRANPKVLMDFGLISGDCRVNGTQEHQGATSQGNSTTLHVYYHSEVQFDGWYIATGGSDPELDPWRWEMRSSLDGQTWELVAASWQVSKCERGGSLDKLASPDGSSLQPFSEDPPQFVLPRERHEEVRAQFASVTCLWPYYLLVAADIAAGLSLVAASVVAHKGVGLASLKITSVWSTVPVRLLAFGNILSGALKLVTAGFVGGGGTLGLPFGDRIPYSMVTLVGELLLQSLVFPGPLFISEDYAFELAAMWGAGQTILVYASEVEDSSIVGPIVFTTAAFLLVLREARFRLTIKAVRADEEAFNRAWERIREDEGSEGVMAWLGSFERDIHAKIGLSQPSGGGQCVHASALGAPPGHFSGRARRPLAGTVADLRTLESAEMDAVFTSEYASRRHKLLLEQRSPMLHNTISTVLLSRSRIHSLDQLYAQATMVVPVFRLHVQRLASTCNACVYVESEVQGAAAEPMAWSEIEERGLRQSVRWTPIKSVDRAVQKASVCYHGDVSRLTGESIRTCVMDALVCVCYHGDVSRLTDLNPKPEAMVTCLV